MATRVILPAIVVRVHRVRGTANISTIIVKTRVFLYSCSDRSFCTQNCHKKMCVKGERERSCLFDHTAQWATEVDMEATSIGLKIANAVALQNVRVIDAFSEQPHGTSHTTRCSVLRNRIRYASCMIAPPCTPAHYLTVKSSRDLGLTTKFWKY